MIHKNPIVRVSFGLVLLTVSLLLIAEVVGFAPDQKTAIVNSRKKMCELLAFQVSSLSASEKVDMGPIRNTLTALVERNEDVQSVALRRTSNGRLLASSGDHLVHWADAPKGRSTTSHVLVPIFKGDSPWATIEISFMPLWDKQIFANLKNSYLGLIVFVSLAGFGGFFLMMKRILRELDPSAVIPGRVMAAFDVLKEGVLILDENEYIVMANASFSQFVEKSLTELIGFKGSELQWKEYSTPQQQQQLPWNQALREGKKQILLDLIFDNGKSKSRKFVVNAVPILGSTGEQRGVLATFDDVTELEEKNIELHGLVTDLRFSKQEIDLQNKELEFLASHDPLTLCLNRRALNQKFKDIFNTSQTEGSPLSCFMVDIDHFKSVNDTYGHSTGDEVIKAVAENLRQVTRENDLVGRYGGEEFCVVLPNLNWEQSKKIAERIRLAIASTTTADIQVRVSIGLSSLEQNASSPNELIDQADQALYIAKESGRNRVVCWGKEELAETECDKLDIQPFADEQENLELVATNTAEAEEIQSLKEEINELKELAEQRKEKLNYQISHDALTGLPTRVLFNDRVKQALSRCQRSGNFVALLSISVDTIERISDILGHTMSDKLYIEISKKLRNIFRSFDTVTMFTHSDSPPTVSRLGPGEFGVLLVDLPQIDPITWIVKRIIDSFTSPIVLENNEIYAKVQIGVATYPYDGDTPELLEKNAAAARNHLSGKLEDNNYVFYSEKINKNSIKQLDLEAKLHKAIENKEFILHYQPKVEAKTGAITGLEALIRWDNPEDGLISPNDFIPLAEQSGLICTIGDWVLASVCRQIRAWLDMGITNCRVAVNFSAKQFRKDGLLSRIKNLLDEYHLDPSYLVVEVTESMLVESLDTFSVVLTKIRNLGVSVALDDFGTGYSSLGYLNSLPLDSVKLDRSFVANMTEDSKAESLVHSIIKMAHSIGLEVTAEGIETPSQAASLVDLNCDEMQGYLFSKPVPVDEATTVMQLGVVPVP